MKNFILIALLAGCQTPGSQQAAEGYYQKDLLISESSHRIKGFGVLSKKESYILEMEARKEPEIVRLSNCHRDVIFRDVDDERLSYRYTPNPKVEDGSCVLQISFLDSKGYHQFGAISFRDDETLPAILSCNGKELDFEGSSACQAKSGTMQTIEFVDEVEVKGMTGCKLPTSEDGYFFEYSVKEGFCFFLFRSQDGEFHKLTTFGYNEIMKQ